MILDKILNKYLLFLEGVIVNRYNFAPLSKSNNFAYIRIWIIPIEHPPGYSLLTPINMWLDLLRLTLPVLPRGNRNSF